MPWAQDFGSSPTAIPSLGDPEDIQRRVAIEQADRMRTEDLLRSSQLGQAGIQPIVHHPQLQDTRRPWTGMMGMPPSNLTYPGGIRPDPVINWKRSWQEQEPGDSGRYRHVTEYKDMPGQTFPGHWLEQGGEVSTPMTRGKRHLNNFMQKFAPQ